MGGLPLALSWLTVLPVRGPADIDRAAAARAIRAAPVTGILLGAAAAGVLWLLLAAGCAPPLAGLLCVGFLAVATRGMHIDGLSDTADGLGCYGPPERAREVMHSGGAGPFGVATLVVVLGAQAWSFGILAEARAWPAVVLAVAAGRIAVVLACRNGIVASPGSGFGALVAGTQSWASVFGWPLLAAVAGVWCVPATAWLGPIVVLVALALSALFVRHCVVRFEGVNGDVLGAALEGTVAAVAITLGAGL
ncbi:adenosylcobinamide-GDP ribazoletransferase [Rhodococcus sp. HM1]|uniref:adenosylcobinamide-GDP ribazoletransferase n=1 Tax=unclassified Rhodococcus (in: high G+C Gram-positive bacteria) TaxID=192944 RepID=UPI0018CDC584|nr:MULTISPECIES: adenosylcobinamide-GDP ribazoletransferase [unclassified Rhodococcus (in: high G+C Gram-positive bacteria)]MBH0121746.1 adenosylcobinamide-GDP ribazoletransferase [Rhodococcus sp. CX]MCK8670770.1 adenosylcobinamide-GDP ribazoletransferase [Rhodococcus sp. HM1]